MPIAVAIVEDNPDMRLGTAFILRTSRVCTVVGEYSAAEELLEAFDKIRPEVILMDIGLPGISGIQAIDILKRDHPRLEIVVLSVFEDDENVFRALCAGASGYIAKPAMPQQLIEAVEQAFGGGTPMSPHIARKVLTMFKQFAPPPKADYNLTPRELEILDLLVRGEDSASVAEKLFISPFTIRAHTRNIYEKLHVHSRSQVVAKALKEGVIRLR
ncbi:MAG: Response regulator [Bacteroidetes bacterium]|nr:Response regulator [Bacteroidota bacterium]